MAAEPTIEDLPEDLPELETVSGEIPAEILGIQDEAARLEALQKYHASPVGRLHLADRARPSHINPNVWKRWNTQAERMNVAGRELTDLNYKGLENYNAADRMEFVNLRRRLMPQNVDTEALTKDLADLFGEDTAETVRPLLEGATEIAREAGLNALAQTALQTEAHDLLLMASRGRIDKPAFTQRVRELVDRTGLTGENSQRLITTLGAVFTGATMAAAGGTGKTITGVGRAVEAVAGTAENMARAHFGVDSKAAQFLGLLKRMALPTAGAVVGGIGLNVIYGMFSALVSNAPKDAEEVAKLIDRVAELDDELLMQRAQLSQQGSEDTTRFRSMSDQLTDFKQHIKDAQTRTADRTTAEIDPSLEAAVKRIEEAQRQLINSPALAKELTKMTRKGASPQDVAAKLLNHVNSAKTPIHLVAPAVDAALLLLTQKTIRIETMPVRRRAKKAQAVKPLPSSRLVILGAR